MFTLLINRGIVTKNSNYKLNTPIETSSVRITLSGHRYKLRGFATHYGNSLDSGHWVSGIIDDNMKCILFNNEHVSMCQPSQLQSSLENASILYFQIQEQYMLPFDTLENTYTAVINTAPSTKPSTSNSIHSSAQSNNSQKDVSSSQRNLFLKKDASALQDSSPEIMNQLLLEKEIEDQIQKINMMKKVKSLGGSPIKRKKKFSSPSKKQKMAETERKAFAKKNTPEASEKKREARETIPAVVNSQIDVSSSHRNLF